MEPDPDSKIDALFKILYISDYKINKTLPEKNSKGINEK